MNNAGIDFKSLYESSRPVYLIDMNAEILLFVNPATCSQHQKSDEDLLDDTITHLTYPDELEKRKRLLRMDGKLTNYEFKAMHYYKDGDLWRRKEVRIISDFQRTEFFGFDCRLVIDLMVEETGRFID